MNISVVGSPSGSLSAAPQNGSRQQAQDLNAIANALQVGDFTGAQKAFAAFQQHSQDGTNSSNAPGKNAQALAAALQAGDWAGSAKAFRALRQEVQTARKPIQIPPQTQSRDGNDGGAPAANATESQDSPNQQVGSRLDVQA